MVTKRCIDVVCAGISQSDDSIQSMSTYYDILIEKIQSLSFDSYTYWLFCKCLIGKGHKSL